MGNHSGSGRDKEPAGPCAAAVLALAASAVVAVSFFAMGFSGPPVQPGAPVSQAGAGSVRGPGLGDAFLADRRALVPFSRTIVTTVAKDRNAPLKVAAAGLKRPPEGFLMAPLETLWQSSPFGYRISPLTGAAGDFHLGQDYAAACGARVYSADAGVVRAAGWHPWGGGNRVEIDHGNGLITTYNHLEAIAVRAGDSVQVAQVIARVGTTGWSTGCHLHFETILHGRHTSPLNWILLPIRQVDELEDIAMVSYDGKSRNAWEAQRWAIPFAADHSHTVLHGEEELTEAPQRDATVQPSAPQHPAEAPSSGTTAEPVPTTVEPVPTTVEPVPTTVEPVPTTVEPAPTTVEPVPSTTAEPAPTTVEPVPSTTAEPAPTTVEPVPSTTVEPVPPTTAEPAPTTVEPVPSTTVEPVPSMTAAPSPASTSWLRRPSWPTLTATVEPEEPMDSEASTETPPTPTPTATEPVP